VLVHIHVLRIVECSEKIGCRLKMTLEILLYLEGCVFGHFRFRNKTYFQCNIYYLVI
jgi:hypothetical protein